MISIHNLAKKFEGKIILHNLQIDFDESLVHGIIGLNGAGKTTFFNILSTFLKPDNGLVNFGERKATRNDICFLETYNYFYSNITGREYLEIFSCTNKDFNLENLNQLLQLPLDEITETYSTGMKKKLALLAILKQNKPIYIFDEPFNGLDLETNKVLEMIIQSLKEKGKTVFISSHILSPLETLCDYIHLLQSGSFKKTYSRQNFKDIEKDLFTDFNLKAENIVKTSV